jgi:RNA polymerase sigma-70 factor (ECF subfamily)
VRGRNAEVSRIATDPIALEAFYRRHVDAVTRFVVRRVADPYLAADLVADVFLAAIDSASTYRPDLGDPGRWLYGVARNVEAAERRHAARELRAASRVSGRSLLQDEDIADLLERIDAEAQRRRLYEALDGLSEQDRVLLEMIAIDELTVRDAATILGISPGAARVRLHRARQHLRRQLGEPASDDEPEPDIAKEASS